MRSPKLSRRLRVALALVLGLAVAFAACKKEEKAASEEKLAPAGEEAAKTTAAAERAESPGKAAPIIEVAPIPRSIIAYATARSFDAIVEAAASVVNAVTPMPNLGQTILQGVQSETGLSSMDWLDRSRPAHLVVLDPKAHGENALLVLPLTDEAKLKAALPATAKENEAGNQIVYSHSFKTSYLNIMDGHVVVASGPESFAVAKEFISATLLKVQPERNLLITVAVDNVLKAYVQELAEAEKQARSMAKMYGMMPLKGLSEVLDREYALMFSAVRQMQRAELWFEVEGGRVRMPIRVTARPGGGVERVIRGMYGRSIGLTDRLPAGSYVVMGGNIDPQAMAKWADLGLSFLEKAFQPSAEKMKKLKSLYEQNLAVQTGEFAFAMYRDQNLSFALDALSGVRNGKDAERAMLDYLGTLYEITFDFVKKQAGGQIPPDLDLSSFATAITSLSEALAPHGVTMKLTSAAAGGVPIHTLDIQLNYAQMGMMPGGEFAFIQSLIGDRFQIAVAFASDVVALSFGPAAPERVKALLSGGKPLASDTSFADARKMLEKPTGMMLFLDPVKGVKAYKMIPDLAMYADKLEALIPSGGGTFRLEATGANQVLFTVDVAIEPIMKVVNAML